MWTGRARSWQYSRPAVRWTERHGPREMENISRGPTFGDFATIHKERSMQDITVAGLQSTRVQTPLSPPPSLKCNVLRGSLSVDIQNIPCATLKKGVGGNLCISLHGPTYPVAARTPGPASWPQGCCTWMESTPASLKC